MLETLRRLILGLVLIVAAAAVLLISDWGSRIDSQAVKKVSVTKKVAFLQQSSQAILDQGRDGILAGLADRGWHDGKNLKLKPYNAEGDNTVSQAIAREMVNGGNDLLLTITTPSLQSVANANKEGVAPHVFGLVTDPVAAGVLKNKEDPLSHAPWIAGYATMQPIKEAFDLARRMNPGLMQVGVVYNNSEANAEAQLKVARKVCETLGIKLVETTADNSANVGEAAAALTSRGVEAIWVPGDVTILTSIDAVVGAANKAGIPVFTVIPPNVKRGALFDLGANYFEVGRLTGQLAGDILNGSKDPATVPIVNVMPEILTLNLQAAAQHQANWKIDGALKQKATLIIDESGKELSKSSAAPAAVPQAPINPSGKKWKIAVVMYSESPPAEETLEGMKDQWKKSALVEGKDYEIKIRSAQADVAALNGILDAAATEGADLIVPMSTPSLQAAVHRVKDIPVVFTLVANPMAAGAGKSYEDHLPNVTGVAVLGPVKDMLDLLEKHFPNYKRIGTLFCPSEANSVDLKNSFEKMCIQRGFTLDSVAANSPGELSDAAISLMSRPIDVVVQISDNLSSAGFTAIARAARQAQKPLISLNSTTVQLGAPIAMGRDYHHAGEVTVKWIEKVISGEDPGSIPFVLPPEVLRIASPANAEAVGMTIPPALLQECDKVVQ